MGMIKFKAPALPLPTKNYDEAQFAQLIRALRIYFQQLDSRTPIEHDLFQGGDFAGDTFTGGAFSGDSYTGGTFTGTYFQGRGDKLVNPYGAWQSNLTQTNVANTATVMILEQTDYSNSIAINQTVTTATGSISGTTLTVTSAPATPIYIGMTITDPVVTPNTRITAFGTGTGGVGTYTVNNSQTVSSRTLTFTANSKMTAVYPGIYNLQWSGQFQNTDNAQHDVSVWIRKNGIDVGGSTGLVSIPARKAAGAGNEGHLITGWNYFVQMAANDYIELWWSTDSTTVTLQAYPAGVAPITPSTASLVATLSFVSALPS